MRHIKTLADMEQLERDKSVPRPLYEIVEAYFHELRESCGIESLGQEFVLDSGHIILVESSDTEKELSRLTGWWPEWAEEIKLNSGVVTKVVVLEDNDFIMTYFLQQGNHLEIDAWLEHYIEEPAK